MERKSGQAVEFLVLSMALFFLSGFVQPGGRHDGPHFQNPPPTDPFEVIAYEHSNFRFRHFSEKQMPPSRTSYDFTTETLGMFNDMISSLIVYPMLGREKRFPGCSDCAKGIEVAGTRKSRNEGLPLKFFPLPEMQSQMLVSYPAIGDDSEPDLNDNVSQLDWLCLFDSEDIQVTLFEHANYQGKSARYTGQSVGFRTTYLDRDFARRVSSLELRLIQSQTRPSTEGTRHRAPAASDPQHPTISLEKKSPQEAARVAEPDKKLAAPPQPAMPAAVPFSTGQECSEDFESGQTAGWELFGGAALATEGEDHILQFPDSGAAAWISCQAQDFTASFNIKMGSGTGEVGFNSSGEPPNDQSYKIFFFPKEISLVRHAGGKDQMLAVIDQGLTTDGWHAIRVQVAGGQIDISSDDKVILSAKDSEPLKKGFFTFACINGKGFAVDDIEVR